MTDRLKGCTVVFAKDMRDDDAELLLAAIRQLKGVLDVTGTLASHDDWYAEQRVREKWGKQLLKIVYPDMDL